MAAFHYQVDVLPASAISRHRDAFSRTDLTYDEFADLNVWTDQPAPQMLAELRKLFVIENSWGPCEEFKTSTEPFASDLRIWHPEEGNPAIDGIVFRYSAVPDGGQFLSRFLAIVAQSGCLLFSRASRAVVSPNIEDIATDFRSSRAARFLDDPEDAIINAAAKIDDNVERRTT